MLLTVSNIVMFYVLVIPGPPEDVSVSRGSSNGVVVTWSYPSMQHQGFIVTGYKVLTLYF